MYRQRSVTLIVCFINLALVSASNKWEDFDANKIYPKYDTSDCKFPFKYNGKSYDNCTTDGDNGNRPWCSLTNEYIGVFKYCYDFWASSLKCTFPFTVNSKTFNSCAILSKRIPYKQCRTDNSDYPNRFCIEEHVKKSGKPLYQGDNCDSSFKSLSKFHTKCFGPSDFAIPVAITNEEKELILTTHNDYRSEVGAKGMFKLYWDDELGKMAQARSDLCGFDHDLSDNRLIPAYGWKNGQNMVMTVELTNTLGDLLTIMFDSEKPRFEYGKGCTTPGSCTHYTQLMINNMTRVGCGLTHCLFPDRVERYLTCNYILAQYSHNYMVPYEKGEAGSACPNKKDSKNLCDCGNKICRYDKGEYLEMSTCDCKGGSRKRAFDDTEFEQRDETEEASGSGAMDGETLINDTVFQQSLSDKKRNLQDSQNNMNKRMIRKLGGHPRSLDDLEK